MDPTRALPEEDPAKSATRPAPRILGIGGTRRVGSSTELALRVALEAAANAGGDVVLLGADDLDLPLLDPSSPPDHPLVHRLLDELRRADGLILASPGYHGAPSGLMKNALDYAEALRDDTPPYLDGKAVGCIAVASGWQATTTTLQSLRSIVHALRGWPTPLGATVNSSLAPFDADGTCLDDAIRSQLRIVGLQVVSAAKLSRQMSDATRESGLSAGLASPE